MICSTVHGFFRSMFLNFQVFGDFFPPSILLLFISHLTLLWSEITFCVLVPMTDAACFMVQRGVCLACSVVQCGGLSCLFCAPAWGSLLLVPWSSVGSVSLVLWSSVGSISCFVVQHGVCLACFMLQCGVCLGDCFACSLKGPPSIEVVQIASVFTDFFCLLILSVIENWILKSPVTTVDF